MRETGEKICAREEAVPPSECATPDSEQAAPIGLLLEQKRKLEQLNGWFDIALNNMVRGLSMFDADQRLIVCNKSYREMYALPEELTRPGTPLADIVRYHVKHETGRDGDAEVAGQQRWIAEHISKLASGKSFSHAQHLRDGRKFLVTYQPLEDGGWVDIQEDITEKSRAAQRIEWLARHDALTGVANRFHFRETFEAALQNAAPAGALSLHWLDLDHFKEVNDTFGHPVGDALLKAVAKRLRASIRKCDFLARLGGDEFAIVQADGDGTEHCEQLARRVLRSIARPYNVLGHCVSVSASIGIVRAPEHGKSADELLKNADVALYNVKSAGRQGFEIFRSGTTQRIEGVRRLETDLHTALRKNQFELHYQPVLSLESHRVVSFEALLRWRHPEHGFIAPEEFLPVAERTGDMLAIGTWVLQQACRDAVQWPDTVKVGVNLSLLQLQSGDLPDAVSNALGESGLKTSRLSLEVAEGLLARESNAVRDTLNRLRALGVQLALDDFGKTGGALGTLQSYRFDMIKIDRSLIKGMPTQPETAAIVTAISALARSLGILSVAEGIETSEELGCVARAGCTKVQGFYFSRPVPMSELKAVLVECPHKFALAA